MTTPDRLWALAPEYAEEVFGLYRESPHSEQAPLFHVEESTPENMARSITRNCGNVAVVEINGPIDRRTRYSRYSGEPLVTGQDAIRLALSQVLENPAVRAVLLSISSPGGVVAGTKELADFIAEKSALKPLAAYVNGLAASGAYWLAASTGRVLAPATAQVGSIGVIMQVADYSGFYQRMGVGIEHIVSGRYKAAGRGERALTDEERTYFQERLATIHGIFREDVAGHMHIIAPPELWAEAQVLPAVQARPLGLVSALVRDEEAAIKFMSEVAMPAYTREALAKDAPELVEEILREGREQIEVLMSEKLAAAGRDSTACALAVIRAVCQPETVQIVERILTKAASLKITPDQLEAMSEFFPSVRENRPTHEEESRAAILDALRHAHGGPVNATPPRPEKSPLVADAERRATAGL